MVKDGEDVSTRSAEAPPVSRGQAQASGEAQQTSGTSGPRWRESSTSAAPGSCSQRTFPWTPSESPGETFEQWATESRRLSKLAQSTLGHRIGATAGGSLLPTPTAKANMLAPSMQKWAAHRNLMLPTPCSRDYRHPNRKTYAERGGGKKGEQLPNVVGGPLNPVWVEWLIGVPLSWTDVRVSAVSATRRFRRWLRLHGAS